ncbi:hypothetical protein [Ruegeria atlantica]|uniref:hypothetical protein n=1 Tax=Ruegeria atlantica TaxID=81569 RepID=UPI0024959506|nr:hypothetical protein [Ruegeria atlantica]
MALVLFCCAGVVVRAQTAPVTENAPPGLLATFEVSQRLEYSDNPDLDVDGNSDFYGRTVLGFGLESVTDIQTFTLDLGTDIEEFREDNPNTFDFTNTFALLSYNRTTRDAFFDADARYREVDTDTTLSDRDFDQDGNIINQDDGTRVSYGFTLGAAVGEEGPLGANFDWDYNEIRFRDTTDPGLNDNTLNDVSGQIDFRINPRITLALTGGYSDFTTEAENGTNRETKSLGLATALEVNPVLTVDVGLSYDRIKRTGATNRDDDGISGEVELTRTMPNGTIGLRYASEVFANADGRRSFLSFSRDMDLPRGALAFSLGVTGTDAIGSDPLIEVDYQYDLPAAQLSFGLSQRVVVDEDDNENINTSLRAAYDQEINNLSSFGFSVDFFNRNELGDDSNDSQRLDVGFTYRHDLTRDWGLESGITHTLLTEEDDPDRSRTTLFVGLERSFTFSP